MKQEKQFVWFFIKWTTILNFVVIVAVIGLQGWVRWSMNQDFTFLGDFGLPALVALFAAQLFALMHAERA
ncbi:MAG: hypothetical protein KGI71_03610 [Patescibacteria group bacterium]|nr:hypothetical protein [Patescibacteria group bacterium]